LKALSDRQTFKAKKEKRDGRWFEATNVTSRRKLPVTSAAALAVVVHA
jgi:hypothetical protein